MHNLMTTFVASTAEPSQGLFGALGIDWKLLVEQAIAFLILVAILGKFVYPALMKAVDDRRAQIEAGLKEAKESQEALQRAEQQVAEALEKARKEADGIIARSQQEASGLVVEAEEKAKARAEQIVADARGQLQADVARARQMLKKETVQLVAAATEQIIDEKLDSSKDKTLIEKSLVQEKV